VHHKRHVKRAHRKDTFHLSDVHIQMARELGLNPKKFGGLANHRQEPWKLPLPEGSVTFIQRFGSAINLPVHYHVVFLEGVSLDRTDKGRKPRFVKGEPPTDGV
jgi:Putative transposase